ncbi:heat shock 70 kDa protein 12A-like isoform X2 [Mytilus trossulus]
MAAPKDDDIEVTFRELKDFIDPFLDPQNGPVRPDKIMASRALISLDALIKKMPGVTEDRVESLKIMLKDAIRERWTFMDMRINDAVHEFKEIQKMVSELVPIRIVAAIDFGTTYSGYAYCIRKQAVDSPILCNTWSNGSSLTLKAPTCVLFKPNEELHSFGHKAIEYYYENIGNLELKEYYYFEYFKMMLYEQEDLTTEMYLEETIKEDDVKKRKKMKAVDVFKAVIGFFRDELVCTLNKTGVQFKNKDIQWVITVPAIWDLKAKQFMRECAKKAGIDHDQLILALEPEAASIHCRRVPVGVQTEDDGSKSIAEMVPGAQFIVLDQGGGTTDIAVHEVTGKNTLKEVHKACGGHWGGITVNKQFYNFLEEIFGKDVINSIKETNPSAFYSFLRIFENAKTTFKKEDEGDPEGQVTLRLPFEWLETFEAIRSLSFANAVKTTNFKDRVKVKLDKFRIKNNLFRTFYDYALENVIRELERLLSKKELKGVNTLLVVGGHSASTVLTDALKAKFPNIGMVIPKDPGLAVLKGAVMFGFDPGTITSRVARFTYGIGTTRAFRDGDPESKKIIVDGVERCKDVFDKHIEIGQILEVGEDKYLEEQEYVPLYKDQTSVNFNFYDTLSKSPKYVTDDGCRRIGSLQFKLTEKMTGKRTMALKINNSGTELVSLITEKGTTNTSKGYFRLPSE